MLEILSALGSSVPEDLSILFEIGILIIIAGLFAFIIKLLRQPIIPAYIIAGIILGPLGFGLIKSTNIILSLSEIGVAFLLFFAGLEINLKRLRQVGGVATTTGIVEMFLLFFSGFFVTIGFVSAGLVLDSMAPIYVGLVVAFSSTMVVIKLLADKKEITTLHGRIIIGILLIQDIFAILAITFLTTDFTLNHILLAGLKAVIFAIAAFILAKVSNPIFKVSAKNRELILIISLSFLFIFALSSYILLKSLVIGAFFAGVALANSRFKTEIEGEILHLRNFFAVIFFVALGMQLINVSQEFLLLFLALIGLILIIKPLVIMVSVRLCGYKKRTAFFTGNSLAQTSEFSLIILALGLTLGHIGQGLFSILVLATIITMSLTGYFVEYEKKFYRWLSIPLDVFSKIPVRREEKLKYKFGAKKKIIIFGCHRMGSLFLKKFAKIKDKILVVDYDPEIIKALIEKKIPCIYGDFANPEVLQKASIGNTEFIISTIPDLEDNVSLISKAKEINPNIIVIVSAEFIHDAIDLYDRGADYVILPKVISGERVNHIIKTIRSNKKSLKRSQIKHLRELHNILYDDKF